MAYIEVQCPVCGQNDVIKRGFSPQGKQRYYCKNTSCNHGSFILDYTNIGYDLEVKEKIIEMAINGSGIRDTARVLGIDKNTVISDLKKRELELENVNTTLLKQLNPETIVVEIQRVDEAELDEMWSFVGNKKQQRRLWHAIDHNTGLILAYVFGARKDEVFLKLKELLAPFNIKTFYTDYLGIYERHLKPNERVMGKQFMQKIERIHLTLRTRIKRLTRKTICFSKSEQMHDIVIGLFINRCVFNSSIA
jgi:IS1 family transposase/transposase-like protein